MYLYERYYYRFGDFMKPLTPRQIVKKLDRYIVSQKNAKKAVAIALRNRWRRQQVEGKLRDEIMPNNIIMIGPTGVGKTELARRLASLSNAPFIKVEASKFTEVGYVGRDVESMIRDLMDTAETMEEREKEEEMIEKTFSKWLVDNGYMTEEELHEEVFGLGDMLPKGTYKIVTDIIPSEDYPGSAAKGDIVDAFADTAPTDEIMGTHIFTVDHQKTKAEIYVTLDDIEEV